MKQFINFVEDLSYHLFTIREEVPRILSLYRRIIAILISIKFCIQFIQQGCERELDYHHWNKTIEYIYLYCISE